MPALGVNPALGWIDTAVGIPVGIPQAPHGAFWDTLQCIAFYCAWNWAQMTICERKKKRYALFYGHFSRACRIRTSFTSEIFKVIFNEIFNEI